MRPWLGRDSLSEKLVPLVVDRDMIHASWRTWLVWIVRPLSTSILWSYPSKEGVTHGSADARVYRDGKIGGMHETRRWLESADTRRSSLGGEDSKPHSSGMYSLRQELRKISDTPRYPTQVTQLPILPYPYLRYRDERTSSRRVSSSRGVNRSFERQSRTSQSWKDADGIGAIRRKQEL